MTATQRPRRLVLGGPDAARPASRSWTGAPSPAPERGSPARSPLRVVRGSELSPAGRRRRRRLLVGASGSVAVAGLFAVVVVHVVLAQQQFQLANLSGRIATEQSANDQLRLQVAQLQAPQRVVSQAEQQLGMVSPPSITYLVPGQHGARVRAQPATTTTTGAGAGPATAASASTTPSGGGSSSGASPTKP